MNEMTSFIFSLLVILVTAKVFGEIAVRMGQSSVIGELFGGVLVGGSVFGLIHETQTLTNLAEIGAIILLFEVGVSSDLKEFMRVGLWAFVVACVGVVLPFLFGYYIMLHFGLDTVHAIFTGAVLTATSVGITARVFSDLKRLHSEEAKIVLGAAVIDDVIGLGILAVVIKLVENGQVSLLSIGRITGLAVLFLIGAFAIGTICAPYIFSLVKRLRVEGAVIVGAFSFCLFLAYLSALVGLAPIVGAFCAGLILSATDSKEHIKEQLKPLVDTFVPVFFVLMGSLVNIQVFNPFIPGNSFILSMAGWLFVAAVVGKVLAGYSVFKPGINRMLIGAGMIPRGEVGLIFAGMGLSRQIISQPVYSALVAVIMATTFITPLLLKALVGRSK